MKEVQSNFERVKEHSQAFAVVQPTSRHWVYLGLPSLWDANSLGTGAALPDGSLARRGATAEPSGLAELPADPELSCPQTWACMELTKATNGKNKGR